MTTVRMTTSRGDVSMRFGALDGLRALAAGMVLMSHVNAGYVAVNLIEPLSTHLGGAGVAVFFVLSGFLLYRPYATAHLAAFAPRPWKVYARHRLLRIFPAYWLALAGSILLLGPPASYTVRDALGDITLTNWYRAVPMTDTTALFLSWTLTIEISFYLFLPFMALFVRRVLAARAATPRQRLTAELTGLTLLFVLWVAWLVATRNAIGEPSARNIFQWLPGYLGWFGAGMLMAIAVAWRDQGGQLPGWLSGLAGQWWVCWVGAAWAFLTFSFVHEVARFPVSYFGFGDMRVFGARLVFNGLFGALIVLPAVLGPVGTSRIDRALRGRIVAYLGMVSYGLYLWHTTVLKRLEEADVNWTLWSIFVVDLAITVAIASVSWYAVERPLIRFRNPRGHVAVDPVE